MSQLRYLHQVVHDTGHNASGLVLVEERKRQLFKMDEHIAAHIRLYPYAHYVPPVEDDEIQRSLDRVYQKQYAAENQHRSDLLVRHIIVDYVFRYHRIYKIASRNEKRAYHIDDEEPHMRLIVF